MQGSRKPIGNKEARKVVTRLEVLGRVEEWVKDLPVFTLGSKTYVCFITDSSITNLRYQSDILADIFPVTDFVHAMEFKVVKYAGDDQQAIEFILDLRNIKTFDLNEFVN